MMQLGSLPPAQSSLSSRMSRQRGSLKRLIWWVLGVLTLLIALTFGWYFYSLTPLNASDPERFFTVHPGDTADGISARLKQERFVRDELATRIALRLSGKAANIKAGKYRLSAAESVQAIIEKLESGKVDVRLLTIVPGESLDAIKKRFTQAGFAEKAVEAAMSKKYDHPILATKPPNASLEGYIYPDTYEVDPSQSPEFVIRQTFDLFYAKLVEAGLDKSFNGAPLDLFEAITLASIVEKETGTVEDAPIIAQVFLKRLSMDMPLGADATFVYAAKQMGVPPSVNLSSPYNTRQVVGLPPGPIANFTIDRLKAVASPSQTDYLYFVTADDNVTHYARTLPEHEANVEKYCGQRCEL